MALTQERGKHSDADNTDVCFCVGVFVAVYSCIFPVSERDQAGEVMDSLAFLF